LFNYHLRVDSLRMLNHDNLSSIDLIIVGDFPPSLELIRGGVQASVYGLAKTLSNSPAVKQLKVISLPSKDIASGKEDVVDGIQVRYMKAPFNSLIAGVLKIVSLWFHAIGTMETVHHVHGTSPVGTLMIVLYFLRKRRFVWTVHGIVEKELKDQYQYDPNFKNWLYLVFYTTLERLCLYLSYEIIVDTPYVKNAVASRTSAHVHVIPQGIFLSELGVKQFERSYNPKAIISVGVIARRKGHLLLIEAFHKAWERDNDIRLTILGAITDSLYLDELNQLISDLGLNQEARILTNLPKQEIIDLLRASAVFALHSQEESQGIAICEALALGLPIISTNVGGIPNIVKHEYSGLLVPFGDVEGFAINIGKLTSDQKLHEEISHNAYEGRLLFDWTTISERIVEVYLNS